MATNKCVTCNITFLRAEDLTAHLVNVHGRPVTAHLSPEDRAAAGLCSCDYQGACGVCHDWFTAHDQHVPSVRYSEGKGPQVTAYVPPF